MSHPHPASLGDLLRQKIYDNDTTGKKLCVVFQDIDNPSRISHYLYNSKNDQEVAFTAANKLLGFLGKTDVRVFRETAYYLLGKKISPVIAEAILALVEAKQIVQAIKLVRHLEGVSLKDAKDFIDMIRETV